MTTVTLGGNAVHVEGNFLQPGAQAPAFTLVKKDLSELSLKELQGKKVILNIFPSLDTQVYHSDHEGTALNYEVLSDAVCAVRASVPLGSSWKERIEHDYKERKDRRS